MPRRVMLDSGAFGVWTKGHTISVEDYADFIQKYRHCSYFVNLDVIPGKANQKRTLTADSIEASCQQGWDNYQRLLRVTSFDKLIPVFHQNDDFRWLDKMLDFGCPYIGISPANDNTTPQKMKWLAEVRKHVTDSNGKETVKMHGFAVTSYDLMACFPWYSVDSASWKLQGAWGGIWMPVVRRDKETLEEFYNYGEAPFSVAVSPQSPNIAKLAAEWSKSNGRYSPPAHYEQLERSVYWREYVHGYLKHCDIPFGTWTKEQVSEGYKLNRETGETWFNKEKRIVMRIEDKGVCNSFEMRARVNAIFVREMEAALKIQHIYFAGAPMPYPLEHELEKRLLSFVDVGKGKSMLACFEKHLALLKG